MNQDSHTVSEQEITLPVEFKEALGEFIDQGKRESQNQWLVLFSGVLAIFILFLMSFSTIFLILAPHIGSNPDDAFNLSVVALTGAVSVTSLAIIFVWCLIEKMRAPWADVQKVLMEIRKFGAAGIGTKVEVKERHNSRQDEGPGLLLRFLKGR